jgi:hypothetical protein
MILGTPFKCNLKVSDLKTQLSEHNNPLNGKHQQDQQHSPCHTRAHSRIAFYPGIEVTSTYQYINKNTRLVAHLNVRSTFVGKPRVDTKLSTG